MAHPSVKAAANRSGLGNVSKAPRAPKAAMLKPAKQRKASNPMKSAPKGTMPKGLAAYRASKKKVSTKKG